MRPAPSLPLAGPTAGHPKVVLRGDLHSQTGYARATRALGRILADRGWQVFAVSLHEHPMRRDHPIAHPVVTDADVAAHPAFRDAFVINICCPEDFVRTAQARNIGWFFWETDHLPLARFWSAHLMLMDRLWAPSHWQSGVLRQLAGRDEVPVIPWPQETGRTPNEAAARAQLDRRRVHPTMTAAELDNYHLRCTSSGPDALRKAIAEHDAEGKRGNRFDAEASPTLAEVRSGCGGLFVAVQTDAARKGLPLLLTAWLRFKATEKGRDARLVIKMSSVDVGADVHRIHFHLSLAVLRAKRRQGIEVADVFLLHDRLGDDEMRALLRVADAFVSATLGEGFGGPIAEALMEGTVVIAPNHTAVRDILYDDYPFAVPSAPHPMKLWNNLPVYSPASTWHLVEDDAFADCFQRFAGLDESARAEVARTARDRLVARAGAATVAAAIEGEFNGLSASAGVA